MGLTKSASSSLYGTGLLSQARVPCFTPSASLIRTIYLSLYFASSSRAASLLRWRCAAAVVALLLPVDNWVSGGSRYSLSSSSSATDETEQGPPVIQGSAPAAVCQSSKIGRDGRLEGSKGRIRDARFAEAVPVVPATAAPLLQADLSLSLPPLPPSCRIFRSSATS